MALKSKSLFLYGLQVTELNRSIDFRAVALETPRQATLKLGFYSLSSLMTEIVRALTAADPSNVYTCTANRNVGGGLQNRVTIATSGAHFQLLFSSGPRAASAVAPLIGFNSADYTGATTYLGSASAGTILVPDYVGYDYLDPDMYQEVFGSVNVSASGLKEAIVYNIQRFWQVDFRYETEARVKAQWKPFFDWAIRQRSLEFTPDLSSPTVFFEGTLETTPFSGKGLGYKMDELLPNMPGLYKTGLLKFRQKQ